MTALPSAQDSPDLRKARGAFFTPAPLCRYVAEWAIRGPDDRVLEPSCGEAEFLMAAGRRLRDLGAREPQLEGVELHDASAAAARSRLRAAGQSAEVTAADFFAIIPKPTFDAVIGNPPYIRYQDFAGDARARGHAAALRAGVNLTRLASSWAAFTVHSTLFLRPEGRLGLVLPAELLSVNYAREVRRFLMTRFARIRVVVFTERVFPGVLAEVVLLLAEGYGATDDFELSQVRNAAQLFGSGGSSSRWHPIRRSDKWTAALLPAPALEAYTAAGNRSDIVKLETWGETSLGAVTGNNKFFALSPRRAAERHLTADDLVEISPPGSRHLRSLSLTRERWLRLGEWNESTLLFSPATTLSRSARAYVREGEQQDVDAAYKCRVREPWWRVPLLAPPDLLLTYMNADTPRLVSNSAGVRHLNSVHGVYLHARHRALGRQLLPIASLNTLTLLGAETVGRAYGGGMLKLEPREADVLPTPGPELVRRMKPELLAAKRSVRELLRTGKLLEAVALVDAIVLTRGLSLGKPALSALVEARHLLAERRTVRAATPRG